MNDDLISRQDAIEEVIALPNTENGYSETYDKEYIIGLLKEIPTVEKRGKWIEDCACSECGWCNEVEGGFVGSTRGWNFCPNCGAYMRGE